MAITVNFKTNKGIVTNRLFDKNEGVSIYGKLTGMFGVGEPGTWIRLNVLNENNQSILTKETNANLWGDYDFYFITPNQDKNLKIVLVATYSIAGYDETTVPIAVGNKIPENLPQPQAETSLLSFIPIIILAGLGIFIYKELKK